MKKINLVKEYQYLSNQWDYVNNDSIDITSVNSSENVWWICPKNLDHNWQALVCHRIKGAGCPCCCNIKAVQSNCLKTTHPNLADQWHETLNIISPYEITSGSNKKIWWKCPIAEDHFWESSVVDRVRKNTGCPFCDGKKASSTNSLGKKFPELICEWDFDLNSITPFDVTFGSTKKVWWKCKNNLEHKWQTTINNRTQHNQGCPYCAGKKADSLTSILATHPELCEEWDYGKNIIAPYDLLPSSHVKINWICKADNTHQWSASPLNRTAGNNKCPYCNSSCGETVIKNYLISKRIIFSRQYRIPECKNKRALPFDFAVQLINRMVLIEFQGMQHYKPIDHYGGMKKFLSQQINDRIKREYCNSNDIQLIEIRYDEISEIPKLLNFLSQRK